MLALAGFLAERSRHLHEFRTTLTALGLASVPIFLVFLQPDFGTALVYCAAVGAVLFVAGTPWTHIAALAVAAVGLAVLVLGVLPAAGLPILKPYQQHRLTSFLNPDQDPGGTTYNITQSKNAIGAGQLRGRGVDNATQTTLNFLPEHHTDFVFASLAEERGFVGASLLLMLYLLVVWRGLTDRDAGTRAVLGNRRGRARVLVALPDLRERRHDDGHRSDHRHPAPVRERGGLVDDREPDRGRDPALDLGAFARTQAREIRPLRPRASACPDAS